MRQLGCLLHGPHVPDESGAPSDAEDPAEASGCLGRLQGRELGNGGLDRRDLSEINEARHRTDRSREERRPRARRAQDEDEPVVERPEPLSERGAAPWGEPLRHAELVEGRLEEARHGAILAARSRAASAVDE